MRLSQAVLREPPRVRWQYDEETQDEVVSVPEVSGPFWWAQLHSWADNIREHGCSHCGEEAVMFAHAMHDMKNHELGKPVLFPDDLRRTAIRMMEAHEAHSGASGRRRRVAEPRSLAASPAPAQARLIPDLPGGALTDFRLDTALIRRPTDKPPVQISHPSHVVDILEAVAELSDRERFIALYVDRKNKLIGAQEVTVGTKDASLLPTDVIARTAILANASGVFMAHNHPSGDPEPSREDVNATGQVRKALQLVDIELIDHVVVGTGGQYVSLAERNQLGGLGSMARMGRRNIGKLAKLTVLYADMGLPKPPDDVEIIEDWPGKPKRGMRFAQAEWTRLGWTLDQTPEYVAMVKATREWENQVIELAGLDVVSYVYGLEFHESRGHVNKGWHPLRSAWFALDWERVQMIKTPKDARTVERALQARAVVQKRIDQVYAYMALTLDPKLYDASYDPDDLQAEIGENELLAYVLPDIIQQVHQINLEKLKWEKEHTAPGGSGWMFAIKSGAATWAQARAAIEARDTDIRDRRDRWEHDYIAYAREINGAWASHFAKGGSARLSVLSKLLSSTIGHRPVRSNTYRGKGIILGVDDIGARYIGPELDDADQGDAAFVHYIALLAQLPADQLDQQAFWNIRDDTEREAKRLALAGVPPNDSVNPKPPDAPPSRPTMAPVQPRLFEPRRGRLVQTCIRIHEGGNDPWGSRCRDPFTGHWIPTEMCPPIAPGLTLSPEIDSRGLETVAFGPNGATRYRLHHEITDLTHLIASTDPFTFEPDPRFPPELQPRERDRAATRVQVEVLAASLEPDLLLTDSHAIDRGSPIITEGGWVLSGNGRTMALMLAHDQHPEVWAQYKAAVIDAAGALGLDIRVRNPVLVRVLDDDTDLRAFAQEANAPATISQSALEQAKSDADKLTLDILINLDVGDEPIEDALRAARNRHVVTSFIGKLPTNEQARLATSSGELNQDGIRRMVAALFVRAFPGSAGAKLAERAVESIDQDVRNAINGVGRALAVLAQAEALVQAGDRDADLSIGSDIAAAVNVFAKIKRTPGASVPEYLAQQQIFDRELTPFQEGLVAFLDANVRSARKIGAAFADYADAVISQPPPSQGALFGDVRPSKEELWAAAVVADDVAPAAGGGALDGGGMSGALSEPRSGGITRYEVVAKHGDERWLVGYTPRKSRSGLLDVMRNVGQQLIDRFEITDDVDVHWHTKPVIAAWFVPTDLQVEFSGRTEKAAKQEGELPFIGSARDREAAMARGSRDPMALVAWCNTRAEQRSDVWSWRPLRDALMIGASFKATPEVCSAGLTGTEFQIAFDFKGFSLRTPMGGFETVRQAMRKLGDNAHEVVERGTGRLVFEVTLPETPTDLTFTPQTPNAKPVRVEPATQGALFEPRPKRAGRLVRALRERPKDVYDWLDAIEDGLAQDYGDAALQEAIHMFHDEIETKGVGQAMRDRLFNAIEEIEEELAERRS